MSPTMTQTTPGSQTDTATEPPFPILDAFPPYVSPTLQKLESRLRPNPSTICEACPASVWFNSKDGVQCYCKVMHLIAWSSEDPKTLTACDGEVAANLERIALLTGA